MPISEYVNNSFYYPPETLELIRCELRAIMSSRRFRASERLRRFLWYIVQKTLDGKANRIKAYSIAVEVFGRGENFDPGLDPIVRVEAGRLRRALEHYYLTSGISENIQIEIPKGSYVPTFIQRRRNTLNFSHSNNECNYRVLNSECTNNRQKLLISSFVYYGHNSKYDYFCRSLSEEIMIALNKLGNVHLTTSDIPHFSQLLNFMQNNQDDRSAVQYILTGSVRVEGDELRVNVRLFDAIEIYMVWGEHYQHNLKSVHLFQIQDDIKKQLVLNIADILKLGIPADGEQLTVKIDC